MTVFLNKMTTTQLEWLASMFGLCGAMLMASNSAITKYGFLVFLLSGLFFVMFSYRKKYWGLITMQLGFTAVNIIGIYNWFL